ncbi:hypothetical protein EMIHUDRAFT_60191, partial [Emiliania huxleyi CCMP1516]|uniref:EF-hand domain-containing protein n=3 Tax=Emiliania huxleyi TaxID=2903 RepID=A0A0D3JE48_EMIH1
ARVLDLFRALDRNEDGLVSRGELRSKLMGLGLQVSPHELNELFYALDPDGSGAIDYEELRRALLEAGR